jgi:hypothetical protein
MDKAKLLKDIPLYGPRNGKFMGRLEWHAEDAQYDFVPESVSYGYCESTLCYIVDRIREETAKVRRRAK